MLVIPIAGSVIVIALTNVVAGMLPMVFTGNAQLAVWLTSLLLGIITYVLLAQSLNQ